METKIPYNTQIENLKIEFTNILKLYNDIITKKTEIENKIQNLKETYNELVKNNSTKNYLFSLDSLFFQYKILNLDLEHYNKKVALIQNRMYGDYYKLYTIIGSPINTYQTQDNTNEKSVSIPVNFTVYKDIDPFYKYKLEDIIAIHDYLLDHIRELYKECDKKTENIKYHRDHISVGISLLIFINTLEHERNMLDGQISLYIHYLVFYHKTQTKYLKCVYQGISDFYINLEETILLCMSQGACEDTPYTIDDIESILNDSEEVEDLCSIKDILPKTNECDSEVKLDSGSQQNKSIYLDNLPCLGSSCDTKENDKSIETFIYIENNDSESHIDNNIIMEINDYDENDDVKNKNLVDTSSIE